MDGYFQRYDLARATEFDVVEDVASRIFTPHRLVRIGRSGRADARLKAARLGAVTVGCLRYGADVELVQKSEIDAYHINIPLSGHTEWWRGSDSGRITPGQAAVFLPGRPAGVKWAVDGVQLCVKFSRVDLELEVEELIGRPVAKPLDFAGSMELTTQAARSWLDLLSSFSREFTCSESILHYPMMGRHVEKLLMDGFLVQQPTYSAQAFAGCEQPTPPRTIKSAVDLIEAHPEDFATITDLARAISVSVRALQEGFKRHVGMPPLAYLREVRLNRVHAELATASTDCVTVAETAMKWGFSHLGRFGVAYRRKFGVTPYQTLRATQTATMSRSPEASLA